MERGLAILARLSEADEGPLGDVLGELEALGKALTGARDPEALAGLAAAIPARIGHLRAETSLALQGIALELARYRPRIPGDLDGLERQLRVPWVRAWLSADAAEAVRAVDEDTLLAAVQKLPFEDVVDPRPLFVAMVEASDARLRLGALWQLEASVAGLAIGAREAYRLIAPLLADDDGEVRAVALLLAASGWMADLAPADARRRVERVIESLAHAEARVVEAAIGAAASLGEIDALREVIGDDERPVAIRSAAVPALAEHASSGDLELVLGLPTVGFGGCIRTFLLRAHRHGVFVRKRHLDAVLERFDAHTDWTAEELLRITHIVRGPLTELLGKTPADDPRWVRRAPLLAASVDPSAHELLATLLEQVREPAIAVAFIRAVGRTPQPRGRSEQTLLSWLDRLPEEVLPVLAGKGGEATVLRLREWVAEPSRLRAHRRAAIEALWSLSPDRTALAQELVQALGPHESGLLAGTFHRTGESLSARLLVDPPEQRVDDRAIEPADRFRLLCGSKDIARVGDVERAFRERVVDCVRRALAGDFVAKRVELPEIEQTVYRYGRNLVDVGRPVRLAITDEPETGRDLLLRFVIDWLREEPEAPVIVALLEMIARHAPSGAVLRAIEPYWRHGQREVRRAAIEAIIEAGSASQGLELSLCRLVEHPESRLTVQALGAVAAWQAQWAEPLVLRALEHREMGVKKAAAEALAVIGTPRAIGKLVRWLGTHDNAAFRGLLRQALVRAAGPLKVAVLVEALEHAAERREIELLWDALDGWMPIATAVRLAEGSSEARKGLLEACLDGTVKLADGDAEDLAAALHRMRLRSPDDKERTAIDRLRIEGFSVGVALEVVKACEPETERASVEAVRRCVPEWLSWVRESDVPDGALGLVLDACGTEHHEQIGAVFELVEARGASIEASKIGRWLERCVMPKRSEVRWRARAIELLRALPADPHWGGGPRHRALKRLGAVITLADLRRLLDVSRGAPDYAQQSTSLLREVLKIPPESRDEPEWATKLREEAPRWHAFDADERERWLQWAADLRLGITDVPRRSPPSKPRFVPRSQENLEGLIEDLRGDEPSRAAGFLLEWAEVPDAASRVLEAFLERPFPLRSEQLAQVAAALERWPRVEHAEQLVRYLDHRQRRVFVREWVEAWEAGEAWPEPLIRRCPEALLPIAWERARANDHRLARFVRLDGSLAVEAYARLVREQAPEEAEHLRREEPEAPAADEPLDPINDASFEELVELLRDATLAPGLAVRAVHALSRTGEPAIEPLDAHVTDPRPPVRSAALRALRRVAPGERYLEAAYRVLHMETRRDVVLSLFKTLAHGRHAPALPKITERLWHREPRIRRTARDALLAWGHEALPDLRRIANKARPDRRRTITEVIDAIESTET